MTPLSVMKNALRIFSLLIIGVHASGCRDSEADSQMKPDEIKIRQVHEDYVEGWKAMDEGKVMGLLEQKSIIQPNKLTPIEGKENIRKFWFPRDGSKTTIHQFVTDILSISLMDSIAVTTHRSLLDWSYQKDTLSFGMVQKGLNTTVYRKQQDNSWKIWRSMWTDLYTDPK